MSQRNPMNDRYMQDDHQGKTRKSAASAKPATKAAASVTIKSAKKDPKQRKAEEKAARKERLEKQKELDRKYYTPDTERYKKLRRLWWACLIGAAAVTALSFALSGKIPVEFSMVLLVIAYALIIAAFYIDLSKIKKERTAYQERMVAAEEKAAKEERQAAQKAKQNKANKLVKQGAQNRQAVRAKKAKKASAAAEDEQATQDVPSDVAEEPAPAK